MKSGYVAFRAERLFPSGVRGPVDFWSIGAIWQRGRPEEAGRFDVESARQDQKKTRSLHRVPVVLPYRLVSLTEAWID
jgi:hypothetical protein